jgi:hypothetical protein
MAAKFVHFRIQPDSNDILWRNTEVLEVVQRRFKLGIAID